MTHSLHELRDRCEALLAEHYADPRVNAGWLASRLGISRRHLDRAFAGDTSISERLARLRVDAVQEALASDPALTIAEALKSSGHVSYETYRRQRRLLLTAG